MQLQFRKWLNESSGTNREVLPTLIHHNRPELPDAHAPTSIHQHQIFPDSNAATSIRKNVSKFPDRITNTEFANTLKALKIKFYRNALRNGDYQLAQDILKSLRELKPQSPYPSEEELFDIDVEDVLSNADRDVLKMKMKQIRQRDQEQPVNQKLKFVSDQ